MTETSLPPISLYLHTPWCVKKCPYCDFNSHAQREPLPEQQYLAALRADLAVEQDRLQGRRLSSVFIGGGTPSLLSAGFYQQLLGQLKAEGLIEATTEVTMEANPGTFEQARFAAYRAAGVNRLSLGVQSFDDQLLAGLGRIHSGAEAFEAVHQALNLGFERVNLDLMHGLPGQSPAKAMEDLDQALALDPGHLSWYQLTIEPNTEFYSRPPTLPLDDQLAEIQDMGQAKLRDAGYQQYEVSAYAREGQQCQHNLNYWHFGDYLGIGAGAHGKVSYGDGRIERRWKQRQPKAYMDKPIAANTELLAPESLPLEFMMNVLRLEQGVPQALYTAYTGQSWSTMAAICEQAERRGLLDLSAGRVKATVLGRRFLNDLLELFLV